MATVYITQQGAVLRKVSERLKVTLQSAVVLDIPLVQVSHVAIFGKASITAGTVATLLDKGIEVSYLTQHGYFIGRLVPAASPNVGVRRAQYRAAFDPKQALQLAKGFVNGKLGNMRTLLMRAARENKLKACDKAADRMKTAIKHAGRARDLDQLRGYEGEGSAAYFGVFALLLKSAGFTFETRERRPPTDPVNALLSFGYALLTNDLFGAVNLVGFDPYLGYLHADRYGKPSLPLDLMEEFRPIIVDAVVLACINKQMLTPADFQEGLGQVCTLTDAGRKIFLEQYETRKQTEFQHPVLQQTITYQRCFEQQARFLAKTLQGELQAYPPLLVK